MLGLCCIHREPFRKISTIAYFNFYYLISYSITPFLIKAIIAGDIDRMEALGIYEVAPEDFALCEFVCSSKMELQRIVRAGLDMLRSEMA